MVQNPKKVQKLRFLSIFSGKVTSMTPFKIGFYIENIRPFFVDVFRIKSFTSYAGAISDPPVSSKKNENGL